MSDRDEKGNELSSRLSRRFGPDENGENGENGESDGDDERSERSERSGRSKPSQIDQPAQPVEPVEQPQSAERSGPIERDKSDEFSVNDEPDEQAENDETDESDELNVKEEWSGRYMYIPPAIDKRFDNEFDRLVYECGRDLEWKPKKNKHYYPVVAVHGVAAVEDMSPDEFHDVVTDLELPIDGS